MKIRLRLGPVPTKQEDPRGPIVPPPEFVLEWEDGTPVPTPGPLKGPTMEEITRVHRAIVGGTVQEVYNTVVVRKR